MKVVSPESLPPTSAAASFHSFRVYHQVQVWKGREDLDPELCGWVLKGSKLFSVYVKASCTSASKLTEAFQVQLQKECKNARCTCFENPLKCSAMCGECRGVSCLNCQDVSEIENDDTMDEI